MSDEQRRPRDPLRHVDVVDVGVLELGLHLAHRHPLEHPEQVAGGEHGADRGDHHVDAERGERAVEPVEQAERQLRLVGREDRRELAPEPGEAGEAERGHGREAEQPPEVRRLGEHAAEAAHLAGAVALLDRTGEEEEHAGDQTVGDHAEDGGVDAEVGEGGDAEHHEAHVRDRRERDEAFHVALREATERAVDDADHREQADPRRPRLRRARQHRERDADEAVGAELQHDRGQQHRADRRRFGVGVGQPGVEREHRHLDREAEEHAAEHEQLRAVHDAVAVQARERDHVEGVHLRQEEQRQEAQQHQRGAEQREEEELDRRVLAVGTAPHADHEEHREQDDLEEDEEEDEVLGDERADHARLEQQDQREERLRVVRLGEVVPGVDDAADRHQHREEHQRQRDAVDAHVVAAVDHVDPLLVGRELQTGRRRG